MQRAFSSEKDARLKLEEANGNNAHRLHLLRRENDELKVQNERLSGAERHVVDEIEHLRQANSKMNQEIEEIKR